ASCRLRTLPLCAKALASQPRIASGQPATPPILLWPAHGPARQRQLSRRGQIPALAVCLTRRMAHATLAGAVHLASSQRAQSWARCSRWTCLPSHQLGPRCHCSRLLKTPLKRPCPRPSGYERCWNSRSSLRVLTTQQSHSNAQCAMCALGGWSMLSDTSWCIQASASSSAPRAKRRLHAKTTWSNTSERTSARAVRLWPRP
ncbi:hypothetical protein IWW54_005958, partial [Coemansia sp. RSA 2705]